MLTKINKKKTLYLQNYKLKKIRKIMIHYFRIVLFENTFLVLMIHKKNNTKIYMYKTCFYRLL